MVRSAEETPPVDAPPAMARSIVDADVARALRGMGWTADETRQAIAASSGQPSGSFEERLRAALGVLYRWRCSDGPFDVAGWRTTA
jgi:hypothetical protein